MRIFKSMAAASALLNREELALLNEEGRHTFVYRDDANTILTLREESGSGAMRYRGAWNGGANYYPGDLVTHGGGTYVALASSTSVEPNATSGWESYWDALFP